MVLLTRRCLRVPTRKPHRRRPMTDFSSFLFLHRIHNSQTIAMLYLYACGRVV